MAEHRHRNFGYGHALRALNFADAKLACAEIQRSSLSMRVSGHG
jgi:hypothetical protein